MNTTDYDIDPRDHAVASIIRAALPGYTGKRSATIRPDTSVELLGLYWDSGSRSTYYAVALESPPRAMALPHTNPPQFGGPSKTPVVALDPTFVIVRTSIFRGKEMGLDIYVHPDALAPLLPPPTPQEEVTSAEKAVLTVSTHLKSSARRSEANLAAADYDAAIAALQSRGWLTKTRSVTPAGRNAARALGCRY